MRKKYDYKETNVDWIEKIPSHWEIVPNIGLFEERNEKGFNNLPLIAVTISKGVISQKELLENSSKKDTSNENKSNYKRVCIGDIPYNKMRMWQGAVGYSKYEGIVSPAYIILKPRAGIDPKYYHYLFRTKLYNEVSYQNSYGIHEDQFSLRYKHFKRMKVIKPPLEEQTLIVKYLDNKISKINEFINLKEKEISLLNQYRKLIIDEIIFKGLDKSVEKRQSEFNWLNGPKKWNVLKLKNILRFNPSKSEVGILPEDSPVSFYPMESISEKGKMDHKYSRKLSDVYSGFTYFRNGDILLAKITPCFENGKSAVVKGVPTEFAFGSTEFIVMRPEKLITAEFLFYIINSHAFKTIGEQNMRGTAGQKRIPESFIGDFKIALPSIKEQNQIVEYLNDKLTEIDSLLEHKQKEIEFMDYYKESLVTSCVTGNIDIRHNIEGSENDANRYVRTRN